MQDAAPGTQELGQPPIPQPEAVSPPVAGITPVEAAPQQTPTSAPIIDRNFPYLSESYVNSNANKTAATTNPETETPQQPQPEAAISPGAAIAETLAGTPPQPEAAPAVSPEPAPQQVPASQPDSVPGIVTTPDQQQFTQTPSPTPEVQTSPPASDTSMPTPEPVAGLSPDASSTPDTIANQAQMPNSEADIIKSMEPGNAGLVRNDGTNLDEVSTQTAQVETTNQMPETPNTEISPEMQKKLAGSIMGAQYLLEEMRKNSDADIVAMAPEVAKQTLINTSTNIITPPSAEAVPQSNSN